MGGNKKYKIDETLATVKEPGVSFMKTFSSQEEAELYRLKKNLERTDMERFEMLCKMMRIGKMLTPKSLTEK
ncbi:MAG: hypothetical protein ACK5NK_08815 [Niabella sp.]